MYLAIGDTDKHIRECAEAECRAEKGNRFGFCHFTLNNIYDNKPIVDLTKFANESYDTINNGLIMIAESVKDKALRDVITSGDKSSANIKSSISKYNSQLKENILLWTLKTYSTMLSELIFMTIPFPHHPKSPT